MKSFVFKTLINCYPPYLGAGIRVAYVSDDYRELLVRMKLRFYNRNYVGSHFGGSLYAMIDPFFMLMLMQVLGKEYVVWDKAAAIEFTKPGRGMVQAHFRLTDPMIAEIRARTALGEKYLPEFSIDITDSGNELVARGFKTLYIRRKQPTIPSCPDETKGFRHAKTSVE
jgi:acyl-coenzyme A thioesterase PaaI-like protein